MLMVLLAPVLHREEALQACGGTRAGVEGVPEVPELDAGNDDGHAGMPLRRPSGNDDDVGMLERLGADDDDEGMPAASAGTDAAAAELLSASRTAVAEGVPGAVKSALDGAGAALRSAVQTHFLLSGFFDRSR